jgi:hypothetical protein
MKIPVKLENFTTKFWFVDVDDSALPNSASKYRRQ